MKFKIRMPARINVLGNPSDANEGAHQTISAAIDLFGEAICENAEIMTFEMVDSSEKKIEKRIASDSDLKYGDDFDLFKAAVNILLKHSPEYETARKSGAPKISISTEIPRQSGLGGSTVLLLLTLASLVKFHNLNPRKHNNYFLAELAQRAEEKELGITCGYADRYVPLFGDIAYIDYRGKLFHKPLFEEPLATYEKIGEYVETFPLVLVYTGVEHNSGDVHFRMRKIYLEEFAGFSGDYKNAPQTVRIMKAIGDTAWRGKIALLERNWERFGALMNENHRLVDEMMRYCGFSSGAGDANNAMIKEGLAAGALGAKLTGAGGGGSVFLLVEPGREKVTAEIMKKKLAESGYSRGRVYIPKIVPVGMTISDIRS